jgi:hypothetical protein
VFFICLLSQGLKFDPRAIIHFYRACIPLQFLIMSNVSCVYNFLHVVVLLAIGQYQHFIYLYFILCISLNILIFYIFLHNLFNSVMSPLFLILTKDEASAFTFHLLFMELLDAHIDHMTVTTNELFNQIFRWGITLVLISSNIGI